MRVVRDGRGLVCGEGPTGSPSPRARQQALDACVADKQLPRKLVESLNAAKKVPGGGGGLQRLLHDAKEAESQARGLEMMARELLDAEQDKDKQFLRDVPVLDSDLHALPSTIGIVTCRSTLASHTKMLEQAIVTYVI